MRTWWLSFCDTDKPRGKQFLGIIFVDARDFREAIFKINILKINPGGEVAGFDITDVHKIPAKFKNKLLDKKQVEKVIDNKLFSFDEWENKDD